MNNCKTSNIKIKICKCEHPLKMTEVFVLFCSNTGDATSFYFSLWPVFWGVFCLFFGYIFAQLDPNSLNLLHRRAVSSLIYT